eukprot:1880975-Prymnesium_polylepis.1
MGCTCHMMGGGACHCILGAGSLMGCACHMRGGGAYHIRGGGAVRSCSWGSIARVSRRPTDVGSVGRPHAHAHTRSPTRNRLIAGDGRLPRDPPTERRDTSSAQ